MAKQLASKMANALFSEARSAVTDPFGAIKGAAEQQRAIHGGLWVGGRVDLTDEALSFAANAMNRAAHQNGGGLHWTVPLSAIRSLRFRKAFVTHIIDIETAEAAYAIRCWGARDFANLIDSAVKAARR